MAYDPDKHHRRSIRLKGYDYSVAGAYFITICTQGRMCLFGVVVDGEMRLNSIGEIVRDEWFKAATIRPYVNLAAEEFVVMPNYVHGIVWMGDNGNNVGARRRCAPTTATTAAADIQSINVVPGSLGAIVRAFKSATTGRINTLCGTPGAYLLRESIRQAYARRVRAPQNRPGFRGGDRGRGGRAEGESQDEVGATRGGGRG
jgi:REP-associated tyrosine transposase